MTIWIAFLHLITLGIEALGIWLLFDEVRTAHNFEEIDVGWTQLERIFNAVKAEEWERANLEIWLYNGTKLRDARNLISDLKENWRETAMTFVEMYKPQAEQSMVRWYQITRANQFNTRRKKLYAGVAFLLFSIFLEAILGFVPLAFHVVLHPGA